MLRRRRSATYAGSPEGPVGQGVPGRREADESEPAGTTRDASQAIAIAGLTVGLVSVVLTVLVATMPLAVTTLIVGVIAGVLLAPLVRWGAQWLADYLR